MTYAEEKIIRAYTDSNKSVFMEAKTIEDTIPLLQEYGYPDKGMFVFGDHVNHYDPRWVLEYDVHHLLNQWGLESPTDPEFLKKVEHAPLFKGYLYSSVTMEEEDINKYKEGGVESVVYKRRYKGGRSLIAFVHRIRKEHDLRILSNKIVAIPSINKWYSPSMLCEDIVQAMNNMPDAKKIKIHSRLTNLAHPESSIFIRDNNTDTCFYVYCRYVDDMKNIVDNDDIDKHQKLVSESLKRDFKYKKTISDFVSEIVLNDYGNDNDIIDDYEVDCMMSTWKWW